MSEENRKEPIPLGPIARKTETDVVPPLREVQPDFLGQTMDKILKDIGSDKADLQIRLTASMSIWDSITDLVVDETWKQVYEETGQLTLPKFFELSQAYQILRQGNTSFQFIKTLLVLELELPAERARNGQKETEPIKEPEAIQPAPQTIINMQPETPKQEQPSLIGQMFQGLRHVVERKEVHESHHILTRRKVTSVLEDMKQISSEWMWFWEVYVGKVKWLRDFPDMERYTVEQFKAIKLLSKMHALVVEGSTAYVALQRRELDKDRLKLTSRALGAMAHVPQEYPPIRPRQRIEGKY